MQVQVLGRQMENTCIVFSQNNTHILA